MVTTSTDAPAWPWPTGDHLSYGGDYNPEQWPEDTWPADIALMQQAGVNVVTVGVFSWARLQPTPDTWDFGWLDRILDLLHTGGIAVDLATATASPPPWLAAAHPEILPVDERGMTYAIGSRQTWSPSSAVYREYSLRLVEAIATRYRDHPALRMWHVSNELGCHNSRCYSAESTTAFREWLQARYDGLEALNHAWATSFWSQQYSSYDEVGAPAVTTAPANPTHLLDWRRFCSDRLLGQYLAERDVLRRISPDIPVTTNFMVGMGSPSAPAGDMDYASWASSQDIISTDHYLVPAQGRPAHQRLAFSADLTRGIAAGAPWFLMEHSTSAVNWQPVNRAKRPGEMLRNSMSHVARGADGICFFQFRASAAGAEKFHSALVPHAGTDSARWREVVELGRILHTLAPLRDSAVDADVAILFDWESQWACEQEGHPSILVQHMDIAERVHAAFSRAGVTCDVAPPSTDLTRYRVIVIPAMYLCDTESATRIAEAAAGGTHVLVTFFSGIADRDDHVHLDGYPGAFRDLLGVRVEEFAPLGDGETVDVDGPQRRHSASLWTEILTTADDVDVLAHVGEGSDRMPALTRRAHGDGAAWYLATWPDSDWLAHIVEELCSTADISVCEYMGDVEIVRRRSAEHTWLFVINHSADKVNIAATGLELISSTVLDGHLVVEAGGCAVIDESTHGADR